MKKRTRGFTLMELLITMGIIVLLMGVGVVSYTQTNKKARDSKRKADIESIRSALELYRTDQGQYPTLTVDPGRGNCIDPSQTSIISGAVTYIATLPTDPTDNGTNSSCYTYTLNSPTSYLITCSFESGLPCSYINP